VERVRIAIEQCANDDLRQRMRVAIESDDDEALERALAPEKESA
jgi:hypothetical protein